MSDQAKSPANDPKGSEFVKNRDFAGLAKQMVDGSHHGVLTTVDRAGKPHVRWMGTLSFHDFPRFYALTAPTSRKITQIQENPSVEWMFSNPELSIILNLVGTAAVVVDIPIIKRVWKLIEDKSEAYFLNVPVKGAGFSVIETTVRRIECTLPREYLRLEADLPDGTESEHDRWARMEIVGVSLDPGK